MEVNGALSYFNCLSQMESTGQAFEEMQEQNQKLVQQLREKDEANLKLMAERIRSNQIQKKMKEEKELLESTLIGLDNKVQAKTLYYTGLETKEAEVREQRHLLEQELKLMLSLRKVYEPAI